MPTFFNCSLSNKVTSIMEKQIRNLLDTGSPLAIIKFLQELEILETARQCPTCSLPMEFIVAPKRLDQCGYVCKKRPCKNRSIHSPRTGSIFEASLKPIIQVLKLYLHWAVDTGVKQTVELTGVSRNTVMNKDLTIIRLPILKLVPNGFGLAMTFSQ